MRTRVSLFLAVLIGVLGLWVVFNALVLHGVRAVFRPAAAPAAAVYAVSSELHTFIVSLSQWRQLADENKKLTDQLATTTSQSAQIASLESENTSLRAALGIAQTVNHSVLPAGIFSNTLGVTGSDILINVGSQGGVAVGDPLVGAHQELLGVVVSVSSLTARVRAVNDPSFQTTVTVLSSNVQGIAHGALAQGMTLDLIVQSDDIQDGDTLITTGTDGLPAGLVVGTVQSVRSNEAQLFKDVTIVPAGAAPAGTAFVIIL